MDKTKMREYELEYERLLLRKVKHYHEKNVHLENYCGLLTNEEWDDVRRKVMMREITLCETCNSFFEYVPRKIFCDECSVKKQREYDQRPEVKEKRREYNQRPEVRAKIRKRKR